MPEFSGLIHDRTGTAVTIAAVGGAMSGQLAGYAIALSPRITVEPAMPPLAYVPVSLLGLILTMLVAGWYLPTAEEIAHQYEERDFMDGENDA